MRRYGEKNGRRFGLGGDLARAALSALLVALLVLQSGPTQALAAGVEETAEQQLLAELTGEGGASGETGAPAGDEEPTAESTTGAAPEGSASAPSETGDPASDDAPGEGEAPATGEPSAAPTEEAPSEEADPMPAGDAAGGDDAPTEDAAEQAPAAPAEDATEAEDAAETGPDAELINQNGLVALTLQGEAASSQDAALVALRDEAGVDQDTASDAAAIAFETSGIGYEPAVRDGEELPSGEGDPSSGSGSFVDKLQVRWITEDDDPGNGNDDYLYLCPPDNSDQSVRMRVSYALSGSYDYKPGEVVITIPVNIFRDRSDKFVGSMRLAVPESPSTNAAWNYQRVGDTFVITNTRQMSAASQGYIEFAIEGITPRYIKDMATSDPFEAKIEVVTETGNVIGATSNQIFAQVDTFAELTRATKRAYGEPRIVTADSGEIPESQLVDGEERYVLVTWYMNGYINSNTNQTHTLELDDKKMDDYAGFLLDVTGDSETNKRHIQVYEDGFDISTTRYTAVQTAYPLSQFEPGNTYTFKNEVTYTLTETDPDIVDPVTGETDERRVTAATDSASLSWTYRLPEVIEPSGHFMLWKYGNSNVPYAGDSDGMETIRPVYGSVYSDTPSSGEAPYGGYYGDYPTALNNIRDGEDQLISYTLNTIGYLLPWTYVEGSVKTPEGGNPLGLLGNYCQKPVTMTTEDTGLSLASGEKLELGTDYVYTSVDFAATPVIKKAVAINLNEDGSVSFDSADDGTVDYELDDNQANIPPVELQIKRGDSQEWETWATANWKTGSLVVTLSDGKTQNSSVVSLPEGTTAVRTQVTSQNAAFLYFTRVNVTLLHGGALGSATEKAFEDSFNPVIEVDNAATMVATSYDDAEMNNPTTVVTIDKVGTDRLMGYTTETRANIKKSGEQIDDDTDARQVTMHYEAEVRVESFISDRTTYEQALEDGTLTAERGGTWYDLLPKGMTPLLDTVELRDGDSVREMYTIENYKGSGRTLLVVSANLTPVSSVRDEGDISYYDDVITIAFDATYSYESIEDYGKDVHNVIAYMSDNKELGSVEGYRGEYDNSFGTNHVSTADAFLDDEERAVMNDLDPDRADPNTLYAGASTSVDVLESAQTMLTKRVMVNNDGRWSSGIEGYYDGSTDQWVPQEGENRDVYAGGRYSYRLTMASEAETKTSEIILYDTLENFSPAQDNFDPKDVEDAESGKVWHGTFDGIDLSALEAAGCAPVVYFSTVENLKLDQFDPEDPGGDGGITPVEENLLFVDGKLNDTVWQPLTEGTDLSAVKAIAIDARNTPDGQSFALDSEETVSVIVNMRAPSGKDAERLIDSDAHAYNNVHMQSYSVNASTSVGGENKFIHQDYTKVGLVAYELSVSKAWDDAENQDGKRPGSVTVDLYANGKPVTEAFPSYDWTGISTSLTLSDENGWKGTFGNLPLYDDYGSKIVYSLVESNVEGYVPDIRFDGDASFTITNRHEPEKVDVTGTKTWVGDTEGVRPASVKVDLYADGEYVRSQTVRADVDGNWSYAFTGLDKYKPVGQEIEYTVKEDVTSAPSYIPSVDDTDITNTYHPYGNLVITKQTAGTTEAAAEKDFSFTLQFTRAGEDGQTEEPILDSFDYVVYGADGTEVRAGTVATNGTISLKADQRAVISEIPEGVHYEVTEADVPGFTQSSDGSTGTIEPNEDQTAAFTNTYEAVGYVNLGARKTLTGRDLAARQFNFELVDQDGNVVRVASNTAADSAEVDADGNKVESAPVTFGALTYTQDDHGKTFTYTIREYVSDAPGYTYDQTTYTVTVKPTDNGDGTMSFDVQYADADGNPVQSEEVGFENKYQATGSLPLSANKSIEGGSLVAGAFTFELGEVTKADDGTVTFDKLQNGVTNDESGRVVFAPIPYDQTDVGRSFIYAVHEIVGDDNTVEYDDHWGYVCATVSDNGNGTLSVATEFSGFEAPCVACSGTGKTADKESCPDCGGTGVVNVTSDSIDFVNRYVDGGLDIKKTVTGDTTGADPNQLFTFRVELVNEEGQPLEDVTEEDVTFEEIGAQDAGTTVSEVADNDVVAASDSTSSEGSSEPEEAPESKSLVDSALDAVGGALCWLFGVETANAAEITASGDEESWSWALDDTGHLTIEGANIGWEDGSSYNDVPWYAQRQSIKTVSFADGTTASGSLANCFKDCTNLTEVNWGGLDTSSVTDMSNMFYGCSGLTSLELPESLDTSRVKSMSCMFWCCSGLESLELPESLDTSSVTDMACMFYGCSGLTSLELPESLDTSRVKSMYSMFWGCSGLESLELPESLDTSSVTNMSYMFSGCSGLESLELPESLDTSSVTNMTCMFYGCSGLTSLELPESLDTSRVKSMSNMFRDCSGLESLELPESLDTSSVTDMSSMFYGCSGLTSLDLSPLDTSNVKNMSYMFGGCSSLSEVTLGNKFKWVGASGYLPVCEYNGVGWIRVGEDGLPASGATELSSTELGEQYPDYCGVGTYVWNTFIDVHFNGNGAIGSMPTQKINGHVESTLNSVGTSFSRSGYIFTGWNTDQNGMGLAFADGATIEADALKDYFADNEVTLYAQWESATDVTVTEGVLEITMPADYVAHIKDLPSGTSYRVYEQTPEGWTLVDSTGTTGVIKPNESQEAAFVNEHTPGEKSATAQIFATKTLDGALAPAGSDFSFTLSAAEDSPDHDTFKAQTKTVGEGGNVVFDPITYTTAGTYTYVISEVAAGDPNIAYDTNAEQVTVSVKEGDDGGLTTTVAYDDSDGDPGVARFDNTTKPGSLSITKKAVGANDAELTDAVKAAEFTFLLTVNGSPYTGDYTVDGETRSTADGTIRLKASETATVDGLKRGDAYAVTEVEVPAGWTAGEAPGNATGTIAAGQTVELAFTNTYAASGQAQLMAYKELPGASLSAGQYEFALYEGANPADGTAPLETVSNGVVDGAEFLPDEETGEPTTTPNPTYGLAPAYFSPLEYTLADVGEQHVYTIREVVPSDEDKVPGVTYDKSVWTATVTVTDNGDGTLSTAVTYAKEGKGAEHAIFTNKLQDTELKVEKQIKDEESLSEAAAADLTFKFTISLKDASGESLGQKIAGTVYDAATDAPVEPETAVEVSDGESFSLEAGQYVLFEDVPYGTVYEVTETERPGWSQVSDKTTGTSGVTSNETAEAVFVNAYSATGEATLEAAKTFEGKLPEEGEFTFLLYDVTGLDEGAEPDLAQPLQRVGNGADGMVRFAPIEYTAADDGKTFTYEIRELQGTEENVSYDETVVTARVDVKDVGDGTMDVTVTYFVDGQEISKDWYTFQNWLKVTLARTGGPGVGLLGAAVVLAGCAVGLRRRRRRLR